MAVHQRRGRPLHGRDPQAPSPGYKASPGFDLVPGNEKLEVFYHVLRNTQHQRPVMPAQAYFMGALDRAVSDVLNELKTAEEALMYAQEETQAELDRVLKGSG